MSKRHTHITHKKAQPPKAKILKENQSLRLKLLACQIQMERMNRAWEKKFSLLVGIFAAELKAAGTIGELRRWFEEWNRRLDEIDTNDPAADAKMQALFDEYDIQLQVSVDPEDMAKQET